MIGRPDAAARPHRAHRPGHVVGECPEHAVPVAAVALLTGRAGAVRLYACRRVAPAALAGRWELPGGKVEPGESWGQALHRELAEELSLRVELGEPVPGPLADGTWPLPTGYRMGLWLAEPAGSAPILGADHDAHRWLTADDIASVDWLPGDEPIVAAVRARMAAWAPRLGQGPELRE